MEEDEGVEAALAGARVQINAALLKGDIDAAGGIIAKHVSMLLSWGEDRWVEDPEPETTLPAEAAAGTAGVAGEGSDSDSESGDSGSDSSSGSDQGDGDLAPSFTSYRYRSLIHLPRNPRLEHLCNWLYDTVVHPDSEDEPEEISCQKLPAAILAAWRRLQQLQQQAEAAEAHQQEPEGAAAGQHTTADAGAVPGSAPSSASSSTADGVPSASSPAASRPGGCCHVPPPLPPTEALHLQHSAFGAPYCTWRPVAPDALPPLHDVLVGVLRVCWERHDDREPSRNIIWGAQSASRRDDPVTAYLYVEYLRLLLAAICRSRAEPLWLWHELQEIIEEYPHWRHHPHEVAVLSRMMAEHGCGWRLIHSLLDHIGRAPMLMYGTWAALWDGLRRPEARVCARLAVQHGVSADAVWVHVAELTLLQVKEHPTDSRLLTRAVAVLDRALALTPAPDELAALLRAERDAPGSCDGVRAVTCRMAKLDGVAAPLASEVAAVAAGTEAGVAATTMAAAAMTMAANPAAEERTTAIA